MLGSHWIWRNVGGHRIKLNSVEKFWDLVRFTDREKVKVVHEMKIRQTKTELRWILGFFSYFREHILNFAETEKPLTDLTAKCVAVKIPVRDQQQAFDELKRLLCKATIEPLHIVDFSKPFDLSVDFLHTQLFLLRRMQMRESAYRWRSRVWSSPTLSRYGQRSSENPTQLSRRSRSTEVGCSGPKWLFTQTTIPCCMCLNQLQRVPS